MLRSTYRRFEIRLNDCSTLQSIFNLLHREQGERADVDAGTWTISHRS